MSQELTPATKAFIEENIELKIRFKEDEFRKRTLENFERFKAQE